MRSAALSVLLLLLFASTAESRLVAKDKPQRMTYDLARDIADSYWANRGVSIPCHPGPVHLSVREEDRMEQAYGYIVGMVAYIDRCQIGITPTSEYYRRHRDSHWIYCQQIVHEIGHLAGLTHEYGGVMEADPEVIPWGCDHPRLFAQRFRRGRG